MSLGPSPSKANASMSNRTLWVPPYAGTVRRCGSMTAVDSELPEAVDELIELIDTMPGTFRGEFQLGYWGGVTGGADAWSVRVEADIEGTEFFLTGNSPSAVLRKALEETRRRIPPTAQSRSD